MTELERFTEIYNEIDILLHIENITCENSTLKTWKTRTERFLLNKYGKNSNEYRNFANLLFDSGIYPTSMVERVEACIYDLKTAKAEFKAYFDDYDDDNEKMDVNTEKKAELDYTKIFIVHGHDEILKQSVARLIEKQNIKAIILHEQPNQGQTIIEKFENNSNVGAAVCLFTADDIGKEKSEEHEKDRARQNVVFEAGFFMGKLGRSHVIILAEPGIELPSDMQGIIYTDSKSWEFEVLKELKSIGYNIDLNKLLEH